MDSNSAPSSTLPNGISRAPSTTAAPASLVANAPSDIGNNIHPDNGNTNGNANFTVIGTQQLSDLRYEALSTARDNADLQHEVHVLEQELRRTQVNARTYFNAASEFARLEQTWRRERRRLLMRLAERGGLTEVERLEVEVEEEGLFVRVPEEAEVRGGQMASGAVAAANAGLGIVNGGNSAVAWAVNGIGGHVVDADARREEAARMQIG